MLLSFVAEDHHYQQYYYPIQDLFNKKKILIRNLLDSLVLKNRKILKRISHSCIPEALLTTTVAVLEVELLVEVGLHASGCEGSVVVSFLLALCSYSTQMLPFSPIL